MTNRRAKALINYLLPQLAQSGGEDLAWIHLQEGVSAIREQEWPWNWMERNKLLEGPLTQTGALYTWALGDRYVTSSTPVTIPFGATGRLVKLGDEWHRTTDFGITNPNRIYMGREIASDEVDGIALTFYRADLSLRTTGVRVVRINAREIERVSPDWWNQHMLGQVQEAQAPSRPFAFTDYDYHKIDELSYPPVVADSTVPATMGIGRYYYFYTRYDAESQLESPPGPLVFFDNTNGNSHSVIYGNPAADQAEEQSYGLRLWRSNVNPRQEYCPMYLVQTRSPDVAGTPFVDDQISVRGLTKFWDGPYCTLRFFPLPDDRYRAGIEHVNNWAYRPDDDDQIELGNDNQVIELLRLYMSGLNNLAARSPEEHRKALITFRQQLNYLVGKARASADKTQGPENRVVDVPGYDQNADWVDSLVWKD